jgi:hypothetical protein
MICLNLLLFSAAGRMHDDLTQEHVGVDFGELFDGLQEHLKPTCSNPPLVRVSFTGITKFFIKTLPRISYHPTFSRVDPV